MRISVSCGIFSGIVVNPLPLQFTAKELHEHFAGHDPTSEAQHNNNSNNNDNSDNNNDDDDDDDDNNIDIGFTTILVYFCTFCFHQGKILT